MPNTGPSTPIASKIKPRRDALVVALVVMSITTFSNMIIYYISSQGLLEEIQENLRDLASVASLLTDGDTHQTITRREQKNSLEYLKVNAPYRMLLKAAPELRYVYTAVMREGKVYLVFDTQPENVLTDPNIMRKTTAEVMEEYPDATNAMKTALTEKRMVIEDHVYNDEWGSFISGYAPIYNSKKEAIGIVGVDIDASDFNHRMLKVHLGLLLGTLISAIFSFIVYVTLHNIRKGHAERSVMRQRMLEQTSAFHTQLRARIASISDASRIIEGKTNFIADTAQQSADRTQEAQTTIRGASSRFQAIADASERLLEALGNLSMAIEQSSQAAHGIAERMQHNQASTDAIEEFVKKAHALSDESARVIEEQKEVVGYIAEDIKDVTERTLTIVEMVKSITDMATLTSNQTTDIHKAMHSLHEQNACLKADVENFMKKLGL